MIMTFSYSLNGIGHKFQLMLLLCLFSVTLFAQNTNSGKGIIPEKYNPKSFNVPVPVPGIYYFPLNLSHPNLSAAPKTLNAKNQIYLVHAETLSFDKLIAPDYQVLTGDVQFRHEGAWMFCDSAHYYQSTNSLFAIGNVRMEQGDTLFLYGAWMFYEGNNKLAKIRDKVRLENEGVTLFTDSLNYDRITDISYFFDGGLLVDSVNKLSSEYGQYSPDSKMAEFRNDVKLVNPNFVLTTTQLNYNTNTKVADIVRPTEIVADSGYIYSTAGWYNTTTEESLLLNRSYAISDQKRLTADTLFYNRAKGIGEGFGKVVLEDSVRNVTMKGEYGYSEGKKDSALLTRNALFVEHSSEDTLYLHADTLISHMDSAYHAVKAYTGVRIFRNDLQGICDTLYYSERDSILNLINRPVLWSEKQQLTGDFMQLYTSGNKPEMLHILKSAMAISYEADSFYNQFSGKELKAFFDSSEVVRIEVSGNAETIFLPRDDSNELMGFNRMEGSSMTIFRKNGKLEKLVLWPQPKGKFYPFDKLDPQAKYLKDFEWLDDLRPKNPDDVLRETPHTRAKDKEVRGKSVSGNMEKKLAEGKIEIKNPGEKPLER